MIGVLLWKDARLGEARRSRVCALGVGERRSGALRRRIERRPLERNQGIALRDALADNHEHPRDARGTRCRERRKPIRSHAHRADRIYGLRESLNLGDRRAHAGYRRCL